MTRPPSILALLAIAFGAGPSATALAQPATRLSATGASVSAPVRTLITRSLQRRTVRLVEWSPAGVRVASADLPEELAIQAAGELIPLTQVLAVILTPGLPSGADAPPLLDGVDHRSPQGDAGKVRVTLTDGQRFSGSVNLFTSLPPPTKPKSTPNADQEPAEPPLAIQNSVFGEMRFLLDTVSVVEVLRPGLPLSDHDLAATTAQAPTTDRVYLANGDVLDGFVETIGAEVIIAPSSGAKEPAESRRLPLARCRSIHLANPRAPLAGPVVWLSGDRGEVQVVRATEWSIKSPGEGSITSESTGTTSSASIPAAMVIACVPDASRILPLSDLPAPTFQVDASRPWSLPPQVDRGLRSPLGLGDVLIPGPMTVDWQIPPGVGALTGAVELAPEARIWGDCAVSIEFVSQGAPSVLWSGRLSGDHPRQEVSAKWDASLSQASPSLLRVRVLPGQGGQIHDRVVLQEFMLVRTGQASPKQ